MFNTIQISFNYKTYHTQVCKSHFVQFWYYSCPPSASCAKKEIRCLMLKNKCWAAK